MQDGGNYEVIRKRLVDAARALREGARELDSQRREAFGSTEIVVAGNTRVRTENNCVPMDIVNVGEHLVFAYNVTLGLRRETRVQDVFSLHGWEDGTDSLTFVDLPYSAHGGFLEDSRFVKDFQEIYTYYDSARLLTLRRVGDKLLAVFQTGRTLDDIKVLRWSVDADGNIVYIDNRGEPDHTFPPTHDFEWIRPTSADHILGRHPHISILDQVFVETVGGDLTIKIEDNTEDGQGIYREPVDDPNQSLDDADIAYARRGNLILLSIKPYGEDETRYLVFNTQTRSVSRVDGIGQSCQTLPEDHGILFPGGYLLRTGELKVFDPTARDMVFERMVKSPNGEDVLYVFHRHSDGLYLLCPYNLIQKEVVNPLTAHGWSLFRDGTLAVFRADDNPSRVHPLQIWRTSFTSDEFHAGQPEGEGLLGRVGNRDLVRGISDAYTLVNLATREQVTRQTFEELVAAANRFNDAYYWAGEEQVGDLRHKVITLRDTAELIIDEFEKVQVLQRRAREVLREARTSQRTLVDDLRPDSWSEVQPFMEAMTALRRQRGHLITLREVRYVDLEALDALEEEVVEAFDRVSRGAVEFLLGEGALAPLLDEIKSLDQGIAEVSRTTDLKDLNERLDQTAKGVDLLSEVVAALEVDDPTQKAAILGDIGEVYAQVNRVRATLAGKREDLAGAEATAEFAARFQLLGQAVQNGLGLADTPEAADEQLSALLLQLEELEAAFGEFDRFIPQLTEKRQEITEAFAARKQSLVDARNRRVQTITGSATRILEGIARRATTFDEVDELNAWFASDPMVLKLRQLADQLAELGDTVKQDELLARLKSARQDALRGLRDKLELFADGDDLIRLGKHQFTVNTQPLDLTVVPRGEQGLSLHLTGTDLYLPVTDAEFLKTRPYWGQTVISETPQVYRAEYLAATILRQAEQTTGLESLLQLAAVEDELLAHVREQAISRYEEGYERGIHDADATRILAALLDLRSGAGLLRHAPSPRAIAMLFQAFASDRPDAAWQARARSLARLRAALGPTPAVQAFARELQASIRTFLADSGLDADGTLAAEHAPAAGAFLLEVLAQDVVRFPISSDADTLRQALDRALQDHGGRMTFDDELRALDGRLPDQLALVQAWLDALAASSSQEAVREARGATLEAAAALLAETHLDLQISHVRTRAQVQGLLGRHPRIQDGQLTLRLESFETRLDRFIQERVPGFRAYRQARSDMIERERHRLRVDEYKPRVMSAFVRNKLINDVYLPMIGDNLAKQLGAAGDAKRTDLMGLLLLISPPGYGKTTLMEYVANRLGLVFMKINGPSLGHSVVSLDPSEAPNATARQEVEKINLAFEMGNNVMLYLDDIQHTHPELLQKFISLCDAQRRIEGVWDGRTRTYDLRGKKFCVVMAGNPYTESGEAFQIPDMLANRADTYNLGDVLTGRDEAFALSFIENALTSNPTLAPLSGRSQQDVYRLIDMARGIEVPASELEHDYSAVERSEITAVLGHLMRCQQTLLKVNAEYIRSASMDDSTRTEPRFQLQGSYRNMNKLAEKIVSAMTESEVEALIVDHYQGEAQTLTTGAEANLLKLGELRGTLTPEQAERWEQIKDDFRRTQLMGGGDEDPVTRVTGVLSGVVQQLTGIGRAIQADDTPWPERLAGLEQQLQGVQYGLGDLVKAVGERPDDEGSERVAGALIQLREVLAQRPDPDLDAVSRPLVHIARTLRDRPAAPTGPDPALAAVLEEVRHLREAAPVPASVAVAAGSPTSAAPSSKQAMGAALGVIQELALQIAGLAQNHLPEEGYQQFMDELRRTVAGSVVGVVETTNEEGT